MTKVNNHNLEVRVQETRMTSEGDMLVSGYVNMTNQLSYELGHIDKFVEKISPGAFTRAINRASNNGNDIDFLAEHDDTLVLASTKNNTLKLSEDDTGLFMEARIINTSSGRDYYEMISSGIITNMSFGFYAKDDDWKAVRSDLYERTINELELFEVSAVRRPAYAASTISNRNLELAEESVPEYIKEELRMSEQNEVNIDGTLENNVETNTEAELRSTEQLLQDVLVELTQEVRELKQAMSDMSEERKFVAKKKDDEEDKKDEDKKDEDGEDVKEDDVDGVKDDKKEVEKDGDVKDKDDDKKDDKDEEDDDEDKKDKKKKDNRSYSLFREEFNELRGGNE